jgi:hypothetical protein
MDSIPKWKKARVSGLQNPNNDPAPFSHPKLTKLYDEGARTRDTIGELEERPDDALRTRLGAVSRPKPDQR